MHFKLVFLFLDLIVCFISCIWLFCQTLRYTCIPLESFAFHANLYLWTQLCLGICMYTSCVDKSYITWNEICFNENLAFHVFMYFCLTSCICLFYPNYCLYIYILFEPRAFIHIHLWTRCVWICMYILVCTWHTYTLKNLVLMIFIVSRNIELNCHLHNAMFHITLVHSLHLNVFSWVLYGLYGFRVS